MRLASGTQRRGGRGPQTLRQSSPLKKALRTELTNGRMAPNGDIKVRTRRQARDGREKRYLSWDPSGPFSRTDLAPAYLESTMPEGADARWFDEPNLHSAANDSR
jgi:hypothetical protein